MRAPVPILFALVATLLIGCAASMPPLSDRGAQVTLLVPPQQAPAGCRELRPITVAFGGRSRDENIEAAARIARNSASVEDATHYVMEQPVDAPDLSVVEKPVEGGVLAEFAAGFVEHEARAQNGAMPRPQDRADHHYERRSGQCGIGCIRITGIAYQCPDEEP